ncbi:FAD-dependent monooxygenase [Gallaecimonas kandeliae]|uniref:FAD-dependent monooxygenase n=1 Tax=Gallaecimonas kandeliae TaxID=3029055 RepID=UPI00264850AC|nr:FAD-dependent monooxygenase [Gallaecimonas kandeliae]WKE66380.1 FAD-dependent monooxygenase [Gallaecimonas kandeliae]
MKEVPVIILGGSLVGLCASVFLSWRGVANVVIEKHGASLAHPRAMGFTERTLEYFRMVGLADEVPQIPADARLRRVKAESLFGSWHQESLWTPGQAVVTESLSPCTGAAIAQDKLEPLLRERAVELGSELWLGWEMLDFQQGQDQVTLRVRKAGSGEVQSIRGAYLIAADGAKSAVREALGIGRQGCGALQKVRSVIFSCPAADAMLAKGVQQFDISQPGLDAFLTSYGDGRWVLMFTDDKARNDAELTDAIARALGKAVPFSIITTGQWQLAGLIADSYQQGRVFLAGDAAHQLPPTRGGFGANTGIEDVANLSWKLAWVLAGRSSPALLDSYNPERQPIGWLRHQQTFARPDYARYLAQPLHCPLLGEKAMELGQLYRSAVVLGAGDELPAAQHPQDWAGQPGVRAPHLWLGNNQSSLDWFGYGFVLVAPDGRWRDIGDTAARQLRLALPVQGTELGSDDKAALGKAFGLESGAALVRPDGIIAWRCREMPADAVRVLREAWQQAACLS